MAHSPPASQQLREASFSQALAPSLQVQVSLQHLGFKAGGTISSHRDRTAEASPQKLSPLRRSASQPKRSAKVPQAILLEQPQRTARVPQSSLVPQDSAQLQSHWVSARAAARHWFLSLSRTAHCVGRGQTDRFTVFLRHYTGSLRVAWQSLPFPDFLHLGTEGKGGANLGPLGKVYLHQ